jgi:hypothetical protein
MHSVQKSRKICAGAAAGSSAASCCSLPATCTNFMGGVSGCLTDATHVFGYVRHTRKVGRDSAAAAAAAAAAAVGPARAAADAIARYVAQSSVVAVVVPVEIESGGAEDEVGKGNKSKIVIAVCAVCSTCVNVPYDQSTALRYDAIEADGMRRPMPVPQDTAIVCMTCFDKLPSSAAVEVDNVLFVCPRCTNLASTALDVTKRYVRVSVTYLTPSFDLAAAIC